MTRRSKKAVLVSEMAVLESACKEKDGASISALAEKYGVSTNTIKKYVENIRHKTKIPIIEIADGKVHTVPTGLEAMWAGTPIGDRLGPSEPKSKLANATFSFIEKHKKELGRLIFSAGSTAYQCALSLIQGASKLGNIRIHTANLLILHEFVCHKPSNLWVESPCGEVNLNTAALWNKEIAQYFKSIEAQAVITGFSDMSFEKGFCTIHHDIDEKMANLCPNAKTKMVIIPIEWSKMAKSDNNPVADSREEQLDFVNGRKYVIITDKPSPEAWNKEIDDDKLADLEMWEKEYSDGVEIIYA